VIDVYVSQRRDIASARRFFTAALTVHGDPAEVITDRAPAWANVIEELTPAALHDTGQYQPTGVRVWAEPAPCVFQRAWSPAPVDGLAGDQSAPGGSLSRRGGWLSTSLHQDSF
jgi:hypothetical protein